MLEQIVARVRSDLPDLHRRREEVMATAGAAAPARDFAAALRSDGISVIAEVKRRSPSRGALAPELDAAAVARSYAAGGAAAVSVLTERHHFAGSPADLEAVRAAVDVPVLRKDFVVDPLQVWETKAIGADALLLIVACLTDAGLAELLAETARAGLAALVEAHTAEEVERALAAGASIVGVNNRDLSTFEVSLTTAEDLAPRLGAAAVRVAESGIRDAADAARMQACGYDAVLVGEALVGAADPGAAVAALRADPVASAGRRSGSGSVIS